MLTVVMSFSISSIFFISLFSVYPSKAAVPSSIRNTFGLLRMALAQATLCFYPPETFDPLCPASLAMNYLIFCYKLMSPFHARLRSYTKAFLQASYSSLSEAPLLERMLLLTVPVKRLGYWLMTAKQLR